MDNVQASKMEADGVRVALSESGSEEGGGDGDDGGCGTGASEVQALPSVLQPGSMFGGPDLIVPGVYLGGFLALEQCHRLGIECVLSLVDADSYNQIKELLSSLLIESEDKPSLTMRHIDCEDRREANLLQHMDESTEFIAGALSIGKKVLVHCMAGVSRSATIVAAYIVKSEGLNPEDAVALVKEKRGCAEPNSGFLKQLSAWHAMGNKVDKEHTLYKDLCRDLFSVKKAASLDTGSSRPAVPNSESRELESSKPKDNAARTSSATCPSNTETTQESKSEISGRQNPDKQDSNVCCCIG